MIFNCFDGPTLKTGSLVCKVWYCHTSEILWRQLIIPKDWYHHDFTQLWPILDRHGSVIKTLSLELSASARMVPEVDMDMIAGQLQSILARAPNLERLNIQLPRDTRILRVVQTVTQHLKRLQQFETDIMCWEPEDMTALFQGCPELHHIAGHNFSGEILEAIAAANLNTTICTNTNTNIDTDKNADLGADRGTDKSIAFTTSSSISRRRKLDRLDCTHPRFDDDELIAFAEQFPNLLQLSVSLHQQLTAKALIGIARHCFQLEHLNFHFCLGLHSSGFRSILQVSPNLRFLDLGLSEEIQDSDIALVAAHCPKLETLRLPFCANVSHVGVSAIVRSCVHLQHLDISWCDKVLLSIFDCNSSNEPPTTVQWTDAETGTETSTTEATILPSQSQPWVCLGLRHLDVSGIHAAYSVEASTAPTLLPYMYHQISLLTELQYLKFSGHSFPLRLLELGKPYLSRLKGLETLDIVNMNSPLPWSDIIEIGNLFPNLKRFQFRSSDVIPPLSTTEQEMIRLATDGHEKRGPFLGVQPVPTGGDTEMRNRGEGGREGSGAGSTNMTENVPGVVALVVASSTNGRPPSSKRMRACPRESTSGPVPVSTIYLQEATTTVKAEPEDPQGDADKIAKDEQKQQDWIHDGVMKATLRSGLEISFQTNGEDVEDTQGGDEGWGVIGF
ncbi:F-box and leucine-rich repeat protein 4 [Mortierella polycephala]|uniref:F-box and leucine-rich repeat protein 4 n=1 Tax=Mortierella polycephala TaxID=41804 RepID=A0A9P6PPW5_9FUNG|nr:F-box and leucine-rich repeat protein 4 [Mortierella polycephala]